MKMQLGEILRVVSGHWQGAVEQLDQEISGICIDTRQLTGGELFVPLKGEKTDGHRYVAQAFRQGARASFWKAELPVEPKLAGQPLIVVEDPLAAMQQLASHYRQKLPVQVVGITGSNGKTTTKDLVSSVLSQKYAVHKTSGNLNNHIGVPLTLLSMPSDTRYAVVEMGMNHAGEIRLLSNLSKPDIGIITNIGESHLAHLGSREAIAKAKLELLDGLSPEGMLVVNGDEPLLAHPPHSGKVLRYGLGQDNQIFAADIHIHGLEGISFGTNVTTRRMRIPLLGIHNVVNALAAIAVGLELGLGEGQILEALERPPLSGMRVQLIRATGGMHILQDAYNASPTSTRAAIQLLRQLEGPYEKWVLLGDMLELGDKEEELHRQMAAELSPQWLDRLCTIGPRGYWISEEALRRGFPPERVYHFESHEEAADFLAQPHPVARLLLVKASRGMQLEKVVERLQEGEVG